MTFSIWLRSLEAALLASRGSKSLLSGSLAVALVLGGAGAARAGPILTSGTAASYDYGYTFDSATGSNINYYNNGNSQNVGDVLPKSATATASDSQSTLPGGSISASGTTTLTLSPSAADFSQVTGLSSSTASASVSSSPSVGTDTSNTYNSSYSYGNFTISSPYNYTLSVSLTTTTSATAASDGTSSSYSQGYGSYDLYSYNSGTYFTAGENLVQQNSGSSPVTSGDNYANGVHTGGYNPAVVVTGVLQPGSYAFESGAVGYGQAYGYSADASGSASQTFTLTLTPAATPEPASLTLLGLGGLGLAGYGWRRRKLAVMG